VARTADAPRRPGTTYRRGMTPVAWVLLAVGAVVALVVADRLVARLPARRRPRARRAGSGVSGVGMAGGELIETSPEAS
jgi:hypothetical protein